MLLHPEVKQVDIHNFNVKIAARTAAITEAHPFTAQAQGIYLPHQFSNHARPYGKGIPINIARGAIQTPITIARIIKDHPKIKCATSVITQGDRIDRNTKINIADRCGSQRDRAK